MLIKKRRFFLTILMMLVAVMIIGCSKDDNDNDNNNHSEEAAENFNEEGLPIVDETVTLKVSGGTRPTAGANWDDMEAIKILEEDTNVHLDLSLTPSSDWAEKRSIQLGADELPDVLLAPSKNEVVEYGDQGAFIPLNDLIDEYAPNIKKMFEESPFLRKAATAPDGNIYALPRANMAPWEATNGNLMWINKKWLDELGLDVPETLEEFKEALIAFRDEDPSGTGNVIPFSAQDPSTNSGFQKPIFTSFGTENQSNNLIVRGKDEDGEGGEVEFVPLSEEYKEGVKFLRELWEEDLMDPETFSHDPSSHRAVLAQDPSIVGAFVGTHPESQVQNPDTKWDYVLLTPLEGPDGHGHFAQNNPFQQPAIAVTKENEHPEMTMRWLDHLYSEEMSLNIRFGPNAWEYDGDEIALIPPEEGFTEAEWQYKESPSNDFGYYISEEMAERIQYADVENAHWLYKRPEFLETTEGQVVDLKLPEIMYSLEELDVLAEVETDVRDYVESKFAHWVTEGGMEEEWDDYEKDLEKMRVNEAIEVYQEAFERYKEQ